ncbi:hypothetical protein [Streptomyces sp. NPDC101150]|uniref:hypothetical protein n=1 Tax=Streptomyces sp. NPDC101150 TaxID=3366114 RepID=UPI00380BD6E1
MRCLPPLRPARPRTAAALGAAAFVLAAPAAFAGDFGEVQASPQPARAGSSVSLTTRDCGHSRSATVDAGTLGGGLVTLRPGGDGGALVGSLKVRPDTRPGNYALGGSCADGRDLTGMVSAGTAPADRGGARGPMPRGGVVQTGAGADAGAAGEAAGTTEVLAGTGLMLAIAAGGSWVLRRRHAGRRD